MEEIRVLTPSGGIGSGFPVESLEEGLRQDPHVIATDAGSTDPGPYYLGAGISILGKDAIKRDLELLLLARQRKNIPLLVGSACGPGTKSTLDWTIDIVKEIAREKGLKFKLARIPGDIDKDILKKALKEQKVKTFESDKELTIEEIDKSTNIVAQMGPEPFIEAMKLNADVVIAGRAYDPAMMSAIPIMKGYDRGLALHMGKILECGCMAAVPSSGFDAILGTIQKDCFLVEPMNKKRRCTKRSLADHSLYEENSPIKAGLPGGELDLTETKFEEVTDRVVKVTGTKFVKGVYTVKLEGAAKAGYRSIFIGGARDPIMISQIEKVTDFARRDVKALFKDIPESEYRILFHIYGRNGVMGKLEYVTDVTPFELGIIGEVIAKTQDIAESICAHISHAMMHYDYPGCKATAGNLAILYSPEVINTGEVFEFNIYHLLETDSPTALFPVSIEEVG